MGTRSEASWMFLWTRFKDPALRADLPGPRSTRLKQQRSFGSSLRSTSPERVAFAAPRRVGSRWSAGELTTRSDMEIRCRVWDGIATLTLAARVKDGTYVKRHENVRRRFLASAPLEFPSRHFGVRRAGTTRAERPRIDSTVGGGQSVTTSVINGGEPTAGGRNRAYTKSPRLDVPHTRGSRGSDLCWLGLHPVGRGRV